MDFIGIDIGSTGAKVVVLGEHPQRFTIPTGWSSLETAETIRLRLLDSGVNIKYVVSTGYGRKAVSYATRQITEISCHATGCATISPNCTLIDVGGQDTKAIHIKNGIVNDFLMNDKCSAGTGKFVEIMANRLECTIDELFNLAQQGKPLHISSLCTVFAESEIINHIGSGKPKKDIATGIVTSVAEKVAQLAGKVYLEEEIFLTGGLSHLTRFANEIGKKLKHPVKCMPNGRYAGALGAAIYAKREA